MGNEAQLSICFFKFDRSLLELFDQIRNPLVGLFHAFFCSFRTIAHWFSSSEKMWMMSRSKATIAARVASYLLVELNISLPPRSVKALLLF